MKPDDVQLKIKTAIQPFVERSPEYNSAVWALSKAIAERNNWEVRQAVKKCKEDMLADFEKTEEKKKTGELISDEEASTKFLNHLKRKAAEGDFDAALAGKIMDAFGIKAKDRDIKIDTVSFKDVYPEEADVYAVTAEIIKKKIEEANG